MHARAYRQSPHAELVALCDRDRGRAEEAAAQFGVSAVYDDVDALLANERLDGLSVATPDDSHARIAVAAAERGVNVLVEKPLATTLDECRAMIAAAEKARVILMVDWHNRWNPPIALAWEAVRSGALGEVRYLSYRLSDTVHVPLKMLPWAASTSVLWFLGSHALDTACWLVGRRPVRVTCRSRTGLLRDRGVDTPDLFVTLVDFEGGALAVIENLWILPDSSAALIDHKCQVIGDRGMVSIDPTHHGALGLHVPGLQMPQAVYPDLFVTPRVHGRQVGFAVESIYHFAECVALGRTPITTGADGLANTRMILAALRSVDTGRPVDLD